MPTSQPQTVIIHGKRLVTKAELDANPRAMSEVAQELVDLADFQLTCLDKVVRMAQAFELSTTTFIPGDKETRLIGVVCVDRESSGTAEIIEI